MSRKGMYRVYYLNNFVASFATRDQAVEHIHRLIKKGTSYGDYEILDKSDFL